MSYIFRVILAIIILVGVIIPSITNDFGVTFGGLFDPSSFFSGVASFIDTMSSFFANVRGLINYILYQGFGSVGITVFSSLIKFSLLFPVFALTGRIALAIRRFTYL